MVGFILLPSMVYSQGDPRTQNRGSWSSEAAGSWLDGPQFLRKADALIPIEPTPSLEGTRYYIDEWLPGAIVLIDNVATREYDLKMDAFNNQVHFQTEEGVFALSSKNIRSFYLNDEEGKIFFKNGFTYPRADIEPSTFMRVIYNGDLKLLAHHTADVRESRSKIVATSGRVTGKFIQRTDYYIQMPDDQMHKLRKLKKKHVLRVLDEFSNEAEEYAQKNDLEFDDEEDLASIFSYYEQLMYRGSK
ncbi:MAG: hypothetical protein U5K69_12090 [Balneolaceae bacterium]|nr:hypothetical protein [Balneolaceae bacterium]